MVGDHDHGTGLGNAGQLFRRQAHLHVHGRKHGVDERAVGQPPGDGPVQVFDGLKGEQAAKGRLDQGQGPSGQGSAKGRLEREDTGTAGGIHGITSWDDVVKTAKLPSSKPSVF
jgi:hypothetical protein